MKKPQRKTLHLIRNGSVGIIAMLCVTAIAAHMYFVYMSGQYVNSARQTEEDIYFVRNEIVQIATTGIESVDMHSVVASHLVVAEPTTVSAAGYGHE